MNLINSLLSKGKKKSMREWMIIVVICGLLLLLVFFPTGGTETKDSAAFLGSSSKEGESQSALSDEQRLEELLGQIESVGEVDVMITYENKRNFYETQNEGIAGIVVVCRNDCDSESVLLIHEVIQALFPVSAHKIKVVKGISS